MLKKILIAFTLSLLVLLAISVATPLLSVSAQPSSGTAHSPQQAGSAMATAPVSGTFQKMIVESGSVAMDLDLNGLNGSGSLVARPVTLQFAVGANSFFPILVFNDLLRGLVPGSMALVPQDSVAGIDDAGVNAPGYSYLPATLSDSLKQLVVEKLPSGQGFDLAVRNGNTGFTFFNVEGHGYDYDAEGQLLSITNGRLLISREFANALGRPSVAGEVVGKISIGAAMQPIQIDELVNGETKSTVMPPMQHQLSPETPTLVAGPDVIVGDVEDVDQMGSVGGSPPTQIGFAIGTDSCNNGDQPIDWFALPNTDHPLVPQNLYRMSGGADNAERFEQIGQSWMKHTFLALEDFVCGTCNTSGCQTGSHLCPGCSDPYVSGLNGDRDSIGSRAWVNPFTGSFPSNANDHTGHSHNGVSHRILVNTPDLIPSVSYFGEAAYISPHEFTWCQSHPTQCNMFNNFSHRKFSISGGPSNFTFAPQGSTVRMQPAIMAWTGAIVSPLLQPDPANDGVWVMGYKVTNPSAGVWHYEYALFNMNLDRAIQSFTVPLGPGVNISNIGFHAPPQHPGWSNDNIPGGNGYSGVPWSNDYQAGNTSITWNCETSGQNQAANAIRWGTLYNFRFDADQAPNLTAATVGFFKTGSPMGVLVQAPGGVPTPSPTPTATATATATPTSTPTATATATATSTPTATATATATATPTPTATATATATPFPTPTVTPTATPTATATATPTSTPRPTPTPRGPPPPRIRPTPHPRP
jgi:hypothetical protein